MPSFAEAEYPPNFDEEPSPSRAPSMPDVLAVVTHFPWPQDHGDALRRLMLLRALNSMSHLAVHCVARRDTSDEDVKALRAQLRPASVYVYRPDEVWFQTFPSKLKRLMRGLSTTTPPWIYRDASRTLDQAMKALCDSTAFDCVVLLGEAAGVHSATFSKCRVIWDKSNVLTASNLDAIINVASIFAKARALFNLPLSYSFERRTLRHVNEVWCTSNEELARLRKFFTRMPTAVIPSAVVMTPLQGWLDPTSRTLLWLSTFSYRPNWDGLVRFIKATQDFLREGDYKLRVVGAGATTHQAKYLRSFPFLEYVGYADDLAVACNGVAAGIVPIWAGAGVKLKTLTLMNLGVPVIGTPVAFEGIPALAAAAMPIAPTDFSGALSSISSEALTQASERARRILGESFSEDVVFNRVREALKAWRDPVGEASGG